MIRSAARSFAKNVAVSAGILAGLCAVLWGISGRFAVEKMLTHLAMPVGTIWLALFVVTVMAFRRQQKTIGLLLLAVWCGLTIAGNGMLANLLLARLEADYISIVPTRMEPFDAIIVMGGGSGVGANGESQLNGSGGRIVTAAQMYRLGLAKKIICGGSRIRSLTRVTLDDADRSAILLESLGVPSDAIVRASGANSSEEIRDVARHIDKESNRVGLITSAWHLPRAMRLASRNGLTVVPIPADFRSPVKFDEPPRFAEWVGGLIPGSGGLEMSSLATKEYLAYLVGR